MRILCLLLLFNSAEIKYCCRENKTKSIHFTRKQNNYNPILKVCIQNIEYVETFKYLEIILQGKITWKPQILKPLKRLYTETKYYEKRSPSIVRIRQHITSKFI